MNVILDTSVWIEYFKGNEIYFSPCQDLIEQGRILTIDLIFAELLQGARGKKEVTLLKNYYEWVPKVDTNQLVIQSAEYSQQNKLISKGVGLIDSCIIVATLTSHSRLWTLDKKIKKFLDREHLIN